MRVPAMFSFPRQLSTEVKTRINSSNDFTQPPEKEIAPLESEKTISDSLP
jgi:hypothetical protein